jgi:hypothetical protein
MSIPFSAPRCATLERWLALALLTASLAGCGMFSSQPPLPRNASLPRAAVSRTGTDFPALVANADVVYFPAERAASGGRLEPSAQVLDAMRQSGVPLAIGWDLVDDTQQPLLDQLQGKSGAARDEVIGRLELTGTSRAREHCRAVLRDPRLTGLSHFALGCPAPLRATLESHQRLSAAEAKELPVGYTPPAGGFEAYSERLASNRNPGEPALAGSYRAYVVGQQFAADKIVRHFREGGGQGKVLVFLRASDLEAGAGVPRYVAQKLQVRQLVLDSSGSAPVRPKLLTDRERIGAGLF